jgi:2-polyprenyl-3-methyl-5-hydroxy-6-metoxy-1,4-benzoquinol methylase
MSSQVETKIGHLLSIKLPPQILTADESDYIQRNLHLLKSIDDKRVEMDAEWQRVGASFEPDGEAALAEFYRLPIWLLTGIFTEVDATSVFHRERIADFIAKLKPTRVVDFGGGFGALARRIASRIPDSKVTVVDPYVHPLARHMAERFPNLNMTDGMHEETDLIVAEDVLEHVTDPVGLTARLAAHILPGGHLIAANCFKPVIACHYPGAFHLDLTFRHVVAPLGLRYLGRVPGAGHAQVFRRDGRPPDLLAARTREALSRRINPALDAARRVKRAVLGPRG